MRNPLEARRARLWPCMTHECNQAMAIFRLFAYSSPFVYRLSPSASMFRTAIRRFPAPSRVLLNTPKPPLPGRPSPAERPSDVPDSISFERKAPPVELVDQFEPIVNDMSKTALEEEVKVDAGVKEGTSAPLEPPAATEDVSTDKADLSSLPSLDIDPSLPASIEEPTADDKTGGKERTGARAKHSMSSIDRRWRTIRRLALAGGLAGGAVGAWYLANKDEPGMQDPGSAWERFKNNFSELTDVSRRGFGERQRLTNGG
jgi:hypothetical protein